MQTVLILRNKSTEQGTFGRLVAAGYACATLELQWRDNRNGLSCIPAGEYRCWYGRSPARKSSAYRLEDPHYVSGVPGRSGVLIHSGNFAGATDKGFKSHVLGCILLGKYTGRINGQRAVLASKPAVREFEQAMNRQPFILKIVEEG